MRRRTHCSAAANPWPPCRRIAAPARGAMGYSSFQDALMEAAWAGLTVEEGNLAVQVAARRRVLGEEPGGENWIETLPRRGYRFVGPASGFCDGGASGPAQ